MASLRANGVEFRRGHLRRRQPAAAALPAPVLGPDEHKKYPRTDHVHFYGYYIGNYPTLERDKILRLCDLLNDLARGKNRAAA